MACGAGFIVEAVVATALAFFVLHILYYVERAIVPRRSSSIHHLYLEVTPVTPQFIASVYDRDRVLGRRKPRHFNGSG